MLTRETVMSGALLPDQIALYYLGQLGFLIRFRGKTLLIDGYLTDYVDRLHTDGGEPWKRRYPAPIFPQALDFVDYVLCTHTHADHTDPDTIAGILSVNGHAHFIGNPTVVRRYAALGVPESRTTVLADDECITLCDGITVKNVPAAHEELHPDENGFCRESGFLLQLGEVLLYHAGDCCPYDGLEARIAGADIMILPVNGRDYYRRYEMDIIGNFDCREAVTIAQRANADLLIPAHIDLYEKNALSAAVFVDAVDTFNPEQKYHIFRPGERYIYAKQHAGKES